MSTPTVEATRTMADGVTHAAVAGVGRVSRAPERSVEDPCSGDSLGMNCPFCNSPETD